MMDASEGRDEESALHAGPGAEGDPMDKEMMVTGAIIDSWVEPAGLPRDGSRLVLQVAPAGHPKDLLIVEAEASLVGDRGWLLDLGENLCHGSPVAAVGRCNVSGFLMATQLRLAH
jgi:hypothetical protein